MGDSYGNSLRICGGCSAWVLTGDDITPTILCTRCRRKEPTFAEWAAGIGVDSLVFLQPYETWRGISRSRYLVLERDADMLTVQLLGIPESRRRVHIGNCAPHDVTPWNARACY